MTPVLALLVFLLCFLVSDHFHLFLTDFSFNGVTTVESSNWKLAK